MSAASRLTQRDVNRSVAHWTTVLGLEAWEIKLEEDSPSAPWSRWPNDLARDDADEAEVIPTATIVRAPDYQHARINLGPDWRTWDQEKLDRTVCHELLHCVFKEIEWSTDLLTNRIPDKTKSLFDSVFMHALEGTIEHLARRFVEVAS